MSQTEVELALLLVLWPQSVHQMLGGRRSRVRERPVPHFGSQLLKIRGYRRIGASLGLKIRETTKNNISKGAGLDPYCKSLLSRTADPQSIVGAGYISS